MSEEKQVRIIEVVPHNSKWRIEYEKESEKIYNIMKDEIVQIYHIGSTAIEGIYAKPIIDILVEVENVNNVDNYNEEMKSLGYIPKGEYGIKGRRFFLKGLYDRTHHVHIFEKGDSEIERHINFRDYMIEHKEEAKQYEELKKELALKFKYDIDSYCEGKDSFIKKIDEKAKLWINKK
ncbi:grpB family protein [Clostridium sporogenes]|uniref:GrpB family protein n=1 Tax=Clostridium sporogenes TaxID=1509 RepID=A0A1L3NFM2_CLOSG|nr:GrpB family protein [Clostridium sporogenes]APH14914.1 grpB family protein [Clostridium sporogenes]